MQKHSTEAEARRERNPLPVRVAPPPLPRDGSQGGGEVEALAHGARTHQTPAVVFLLEQARGLGAATRLASQGSPFDFMQASTSMLEAKGEAILSWCEDDNFILEDDLAPDFEELPFGPWLGILSKFVEDGSLSLHGSARVGLHALAAQLLKLKLSQRLFIEEDLLLDDLAVASEDNQMLIQYDTSLESDAKGSLVQHNFKDIEPRKDAIGHEHASNIYYDDQMKTDCQFEYFEEETTASTKISTQLVHSDTENDKSHTGITDIVPSTGHSEGSKLQVVSAEEELDMLLNSLSGTQLSSSNLDESFGNNSSLGGMKINETNEKVRSSPSSKSLALAPLDDSLDVLLSETSLSVQNEGFVASSLISQPTVNSDNDIDFRYAKQIDVTTSINDLVDDLLADTSLGLNDQKQTTSAQGQQNISNVSGPPHSSPSNLSADFDSWFDSL